MKPNGWKYQGGRCLTRRLTRQMVAAGMLFLLGHGAMPAVAAPDVPFLVSAYKAAEKKPENPGLSATVTMTTLGSNSSGPKVLVAQGPLLMEGDLLGGRLPMTFSDANAAPAGAHSLFFNVSKTGRIGLQWLLNDKPLDGHPMQAFDTDVAGSTLTKKLNWNGAYRLVTVSVERKLGMIGGPMILVPGRRPMGGGIFQTKPKPTPTPKPLVIFGGTVKIKRKPTGRKLRVTARFVVTNSDDGVGGIFGNADDSVEMGGSILFGNQVAFNFSSRSAQQGTEVQAKNMESVTLSYADPNHRLFRVEGKIYDRDTASASDTMWVGNERVDLIAIMESNREFRIRGDRNSESGDLYIRVVDEGEVF